MKFLAGRPHHPGSPQGKANADFIAGRFTDWGFETEIETFEVLFPTPNSRSLELLGPDGYTAVLAEPPLPEDATSGQGTEQLPIYNAYSTDGDVTGELVYVNYGIPADYEELEKRGIDVRGRIVIARYGGSWRGIKPKVAAEKGAIGCIIYSDPSGDGFRAGDVYPEGGYRNEFGAQRGSVMDMPLHTGDPLTPFTPSLPGARRLALQEAKTLTKIPVLPVSWHDALPLLKALGGPVAPSSWKGALPVTYHLGPGPAKVRLAVSFDWETVPIYNVIAMMRGAESPDQWIIRGNHHDAWVNGATDPVSGLVAMMAEARAFGELARIGWKPKRSIVYCAWDAEEPGLIGSTEWVEAHADALKQKAVVYINSDSNSRGFLYVGGSHTLEKFINTVARDVPDPLFDISVQDRARAARLAGADESTRAKLGGGGDLPIYPLGSGSDYTPFLQHLGVASLNIGFGGEDQYGQYHSIYDSYDHYKRFMDGNFVYGVALARVCGRAVLRLADADVLSFEFSNFSSTISEYVQEVTDLADRLRKETKEHNTRVGENSIVYASDPRENLKPSVSKEPVPHFNFAPLRNALTLLVESADRYTAKVNEIVASGMTLPPGKRKALDALLMGMERRLTLEQGLPGRPWYIHHVYAPGAYTGYGVKTLPTVREALEERQWDTVDAHIVMVARVLGTYTAGINEALSIITGS
jgi:N-acetylated-alpha-linked acidic dipeptidase